MSFAPVYLDWNATTPLDPAVREAMLPWLGAAEPARFGRICEVVGADEDTKRRARLRWRGYADAGLTPTKHDL